MRMELPPFCAMLLPGMLFCCVFSSQIVYAERPLTDNHRSLASYGLKDGDVVILRQKENADPRPPVQFSSKTSTVHHLVTEVSAGGRAV